MEKKNLSLLYLAKYAPKENTFSKENDITYQKYHRDVYDELNRMFDMVTPSRDIAEFVKHADKYDYIFSLYNQAPFRNSEVLISTVAEYYKVPYLGARPNIRAVAEDKVLAKVYAKHLGLETPKWKTYDYDQIEQLTPPEFAPPYFVKPRFAAGSRCIDESSICKDWQEAKIKIIDIATEKKDILLEQQIIGTYYTCPVLDNYSDHLFLPCIREESTLKDNVVSHAQKRRIEHGLTRTIESDSNIQKILYECTQKMYHAIKPLDYTRFDYILDKEGVPHFLEFNVCCNLGKHSTFYQAAKHVGFTYHKLLQNIVFSSLWRQGAANNIIGKYF